MALLRTDREGVLTWLSQEPHCTVRFSKDDIFTEHCYLTSIFPLERDGLLEIVEEPQFDRRGYVVSGSIKITLSGLDVLRGILAERASRPTGPVELEW